MTGIKCCEQFSAVSRTNEIARNGINTSLVDNDYEAASFYRTSQRSYFVPVALLFATLILGGLSALTINLVKAEREIQEEDIRNKKQQSTLTRFQP